MGALRQGLRRAQQAASRLLRIVALILFAVTAALAVGLVAVRGVLSSADALHAAADQSGFEARGDTLAADLFLQLAGADAERVADNYPPQTWRAVAEQLLPADWLSQQAHAIIAAFHPWLEGEAAEMPVVLLDLAPVIARLQGPAGAQAILPLLQNRPLCETEPGAAPAIGLEDGLITCLPREANLNAVAGDVASTVAGRLPASYPIGGTGVDQGTKGSRRWRHTI